MTRPLLAAAVSLTTLLLSARIADAQRAVGIDVSSFQDTIDWTTVAKPVAQGGGGIQFAFIRASRGRATSTSTLVNKDSTYDANIADAKSAGVLAGAYHYARYDINDPLEEANDFLAVARDQMAPGYLRPVLDLEQANSLTKAALTTWALTFSDRIQAVTGIRPIIYCNTDFATNEIDGTTTTASGVTLPQHDLWIARYTLFDDGTDPRPTAAQAATAAANAQTQTPPTPSGYASPYGVFKTASNPVPWDFWQYTNAGRTAGITSGYVDQDVANGDVEYVKDFVVPAVWTDLAGGNFGGAAKWNDYDGTAGTLYFPDANTRATISLPTAAPTITYNGANRTVRSLLNDEAMTFTSGTLTAVQYANFTAAVQVNGGGLVAASVGNAGTMTIAGGAVTASGAFTGAGTTSVSAGTLAAASLAQASLAITGGTTTVTGAIVTTAGTSVAAGTLNVGSTPSGTLAVTGTGLARFTGTGGSKVTTLALANTATLDVGLTEFAVDYAGTSTLPAIRAAANAGAIVSNKSVAGVTAAAAVEAKAKFGPSFTSASFGDVTPVTVDATTVLIALALFGDTNFDRVVNVVDLATLSGNFGKSGAVFTWQDGNFTADNSVTAADVALLSANYGRTLNADGTFTAANPAQYAIDVAGFANLVPEPTSLATLAGALGAALLRRRRQRQ